MLKEDIVLSQVHKIRKTFPRVETRKLHFMLKPILASHQIEIERDYLFNLLANHKLLICSRKRKAITTNSRHWMRKYNNLIKFQSITRAEQVWVSDIAYIRLINQ